ncbi:MAG TPA: G5 domain-containing protein [Candidatus Saccharibacteria bacterium]|jgi:uncharacterized protein YabE (DUF348 family)|nr:G5 domain-containing protein [Candidatus Saccharibacteria bacterium]HMT55327.1 G5 domain-containing protein [Candidatus Saccharibacteria bacterium]
MKKKKIISGFKRKRKSVLKKSKFLLKHPLVVPSISFVSFFFIGLMLFVMIGGSTQGPSDARIVNLYVDGEQRTVTTRARTVGELIKRLNISMISEDLVEPHQDALILEDNTQVNIYRARPVEVIDGKRIFTLLTAQRAPRLVAEEAGLDLYTEDDARFERVEENVLASVASEQLVIDRSVEVQLNLYGAIKLMRTTQQDVQSLLEKEGVRVGDGETVEPSLASKITSGMLISVNKPGVKTAVVTEDIPYSSETKDDGDIQAGKVQIERAGINGQRAVVYEITETDGVETARREIQNVTIKEPVSEIRLRGTKIVTPSYNPSVTVSGDKTSLMAAAGIAESDYAYVDYVVSHESGWKPGAANSYSGAYGLCQALPASKMASAGSDYLTNPITQLQWCTGYAQGRYGSWAGAYAAWQVQGWW